MHETPSCVGALNTTRKWLATLPSCVTVVPTGISYQSGQNCSFWGPVLDKTTSCLFFPVACISPSDPLKASQHGRGFLASLRLISVCPAAKVHSVFGSRAYYTDIIGNQGNCNSLFWNPQWPSRPITQGDSINKSYFLGETLCFPTDPWFWLTYSLHFLLPQIPPLLNILTFGISHLSSHTCSTLPLLNLF